MASLFTTFFNSMRRRVPPTRTAGVAGTAVFGGFVDDRERNAKLRGEAKYATYADIVSNTSIAAASIRTFLNLVGKAGWTVEPNEYAANKGQAERAAELVQRAMEEMATPWPRVVRRTAMFKFYGFSIQEWTARRASGGEILMADVAPRPQHTIYQWDVEEDGTVNGVVQRSPQNAASLYMPRNKIVYAVDDSLSDSPEGLGLLRNIAEPALRLRRLEQLEAFGYETDLRGIPIGRAPLGELQAAVKQGELTEAQALELTAPLTTFIQKHIKNPELGLLMDSVPYATLDEKGTPSAVPQWDLKLLEGGGGSMEAVASAIERLNRELARIMGTEHLLLGGDGRGSMALSRDKTQSFALVVDSTLTELEFTMRQDYARPLVMLNGLPEDAVPELKTEQVQFRDVEQLTQALVDLATAGSPIMAGDPVVDEIRDLLGLRRQPDDLLTATMEAAMVGLQNLPGSAGTPSGGPGGGGETEDENDPNATPDAQGQE